MKRLLDEDPTAVIEVEKLKKKVKSEEEEEEEVRFSSIDEDLLFEILRHVDDARDLAAAACVSKLWNKTGKDERLWEMMYTRHWSKRVGSSKAQLRSVVLALGGFRRFYSSCVWPLMKPASSSSSSSSSAGRRPAVVGRLGKDEVHLSLSLLSIGYYSKMNAMPMPMPMPKKNN